MAKDGVSTGSASIVVGGIFSIVNIALTAVRAGKYVLHSMTADVSGQDVMQFENVRDLASSLWMGIPVVLALVTHCLSIAMWSSLPDIGIGGAVFFVLVYVEVMIFILPWIMSEGSQCCVARFRTRFLIGLQVLTTLLTSCLAFVWFEWALNAANDRYSTLPTTTPTTVATTAAPISATTINDTTLHDSDDHDHDDENFHRLVKRVIR
jgi:hypothetical protein